MTSFYPRQGGKRILGERHLSRFESVIVLMRICRNDFHENFSLSSKNNFPSDYSINLSLRFQLVFAGFRKFVRGANTKTNFRLNASVEIFGFPKASAKCMLMDLRDLKLLILNNFY